MFHERFNFQDGRALDAALYYWHHIEPEIKKTYFFRDGQYSRYNDDEQGVNNSF